MYFEVNMSTLNMLYRMEPGVNSFAIKHSIIFIIRNPQLDLNINFILWLNISQNILL